MKYLVRLWHKELGEYTTFQRRSVLRAEDFKSKRVFYEAYRINRYFNGSQNYDVVELHYYKDGELKHVDGLQKVW